MLDNINYLPILFIKFVLFEFILYTIYYSSIINTNKDWSDTVKTKTKLMQLKIIQLEEELVFKRKENELKLKLLTAELTSKKLKLFKKREFM